MRRLLLVVLLAVPAGAPAAADGPAPALLVRAGSVSGTPGADAVLVTAGRIEAVGRYVDGYVSDRPVPPDATRLFVPGAEILPGFIDAGTLLAGDRPGGEAVTADVRAADGFDPFRDYGRILAAGVTTVAIDPGRRRLLPGLSAVARLGTGTVRGRLLDAGAALHVVLTEAGRNPPAVYDPPAAPAEGTAPLDPARSQLPTTLAGAMLRLRELFSPPEGGLSPGRDEVDVRGLPAIARARAGEIPVVLHADRADEIRAALRLVREYRDGGMRFVLAGGEEAAVLAREIAEAGLPVILDAGFAPGRMPADEAPEAIARRERALDAAAALNRHGGRVAFRSSGDPADLPFLAARFLRPGYGPEDLVASLTSVAARILGVDDRVGAVAPGLDADFLVVGEGSSIEAVVAGGEVVHRRSPDPELLVVRAGTIHADRGKVIENAGVLVAGSRILEVGAVARPAAARVLHGAVVVPGFIDAHGWVGLVDPEGRGNPPGALPLSLPTALALAPGDPAFAPVVRAGVTTFLAAPPGRGLVAGTASLAHTAGRTRDELVRVETGAVVFTVSGTRDLPATLAQLSGVLGQARGYAAAHAAYGAAKAEYDDWVAKGRPGEKRKEPKAPGTDPNREPLRAILEGRIPALVRVTSAVEAREVLRLFAGEFGVAPLLVGAENALATAPDMAKAGVAVVLGPRLVVDGPTGPVNLPAEYARAGVPVLFGSSGSTGAAWLPATVAHAVSRGLGPGAALAGLTWGAADRLGVGEETGRIAPGRSADLVVLSGPPFAPETRVLAVVRGGRVVYEEREESR